MHLNTLKRKEHYDVKTQKRQDFVYFPSLKYKL